ncbi:MAG: acyl carrier protein [Isosphaeraceae bacterium]
MSQVLQDNGSATGLFPVLVDLIRSVSATSREREISHESLLLEDLALDSLDLVRVLLQIENDYQVSIDLDQVPKLRQIGDLIELIDRQIHPAV